MTNCVTKKGHISNSAPLISILEILQILLILPVCKSAGHWLRRQGRSLKIYTYIYIYIHIYIHTLHNVSLVRHPVSKTFQKKLFTRALCGLHIGLRYDLNIFYQSLLPPWVTGLQVATPAVLNALQGNIKAPSQSHLQGPYAILYT